MALERTITPDENNGTNIFVFGSNLQGRHGKGAALEAKLHWGAVQGEGDGRTGQAYAIPTKWSPYQSMTLDTIGDYAWKFKRYAAQHPELTFLLTKVGCGLAGKPENAMARMFHDVPDNVKKPWFW